MVVGPLPASASAEGSLRIPNMFLPGMLRQPVEIHAAAHAITTTLVRCAFFICFLPILETEKTERTSPSFFRKFSCSKSIKSARSAQTTKTFASQAGR